jgi:crotonobetainyl-CoA:carnitine CoA-transferase CaiB-like acyl-CoA transferase|tara:strand:+ start:419 stop:2800 length:2382 start_codon:yes stop_codon:yes gene_type:complete
VNNQFLNGVSILDLSEGVAGPFCSKLLCDLGAETVKIERPDTGDVSRGFGPFPDGQPHPERSASFFFFNTGKRSVVLDLDVPAGQTTLARLVGCYDVVIGCEALKRAGIGHEQIRAWNPAAIFTSVTGFGGGGPYCDYESSHLIACAVGGWAQLCGVPERRPLQVGGATTETLAGAYAAAATLLAVLGRSRHGNGEYIDVSTQQAVLCGAQIPSLLYEYRGILAERYSSVGSGAGACYMLPTRDGIIGLNALTLAQWQMLCAFLGREDIALDEHYQGISWATPDDRLEEIRGIFRDALTDRSAVELFHEAQARRVPFGLVPNLQQLFELTPHQERGFFQTLEHPECGPVQVPGVPFKSAAGEIEINRPPLLGEHTKEILATIDLIAAPSEKQTHNHPPSALPLEGLRVMDMSMFFAGPALAQILADAGADVIKIESLQRIDGWRGSGTITEDDVPSWEASPYFNWINRNKRDVTLDLTDTRAVSAIKTLVRKADILIENYTPRVMDGFDLSYESLRAINPRLIMISLSGFGADVSWRDYVAFGMSTEQMSGMNHLTGYGDGEPLFTGMTGGDLFAGVMGAVDLLAALHRRDRTGEGLHLDFSQIEACNLYLGDAMTGWSLANYDPGRMGNKHPGYALQGTYACANDGWIAISCKTPDQLHALCAMAGIDDEHDDVDGQLENWTAQQEKTTLMHELQRVGVPAGAVFNGLDLLGDPHLAAREAFLAQDRPGLGVKHYPAQPYRLHRAATPPDRRAPLLGEHLEEVLAQEAGLSSEEIAQLVIDDVTGTLPIAAR